MAKRTEIPNPSELHGRADELLREIAQSHAAITALRVELQARLDAVIAEYKDGIDALSARLDSADHAVRRFAKRHSEELFAESDRVELRYGALMHAVERRVRRTRDMLERLESLGAVEAIKIAKSVDWDAVDKWPDERLVEAGTERVRKDVYCYETKAVGE